MLWDEDAAKRLALAPPYRPIAFADGSSTSSLSPVQVNALLVERKHQPIANPFPDTLRDAAAGLPTTSAESVASMFFRSYTAQSTHDAAIIEPALVHDTVPVVPVGT